MKNIERRGQRERVRGSIVLWVEQILFLCLNDISVGIMNVGHAVPSANCLTPCTQW